MFLDSAADIPFTFFTDLVPFIASNYSRRAPDSFRHTAALLTEPVIFVTNPILLKSLGAEK
jgi:hypothetical protein